MCVWMSSSSRGKNKQNTEPQEHTYSFQDDVRHSSLVLCAEAPCGHGAQSDTEGPAPSDEGHVGFWQAFDSGALAHAHAD